MLSTLRMVRGAVSTKNIVPAMTHFFIYQGRIQGTNGKVAIDAPLPELEQYSLTVPADKFIRAVDSCGKEPSIQITESKVVLSEGKLKVRLPILQNDAFPRTEPDGQDYTPEEPLLPVLRRMLPFVSTDASKPWSTGILFSESGELYATNNVIVVRGASSFLQGTGHSINLPSYAIEELLSVGEEPTSFGIREDEGSITFHYESGAWLQCRALENNWPIEAVRKMFEAIKPKQLKALPKGLREGVARILPFCPDEKFRIICMGEHGISTADGEQSAEIGGFDLTEAKFNGDMLQLVLGEASKACFRAVEDGASWFVSNELTGVFVGVKL